MENVTDGAGCGSGTRADDTASNNDTRGSEVTRELGQRETRDEAKRVILKTRSNGPMEDMVVQDESVLCSSCHKTVLHPEWVVG